MADYKPKHAYHYNSANDGTGFSRAMCTGGNLSAPCAPGGICPRHDPANYADCMGRHAAGHDGTPCGAGSTF